MQGTPAAPRPLAALAGSLYVIGLLFVIVPPFDILIGVVSGTPDPGLARWRFGVVGLVSTQLPLMLLGMVVLLTAAHLKGHRWIARIIGALCGLGAVVILAAIGLFTLDALEIRSTVVEQLARTYDLTLVKTIFAMLMGTVASALLAVAAFKVVGPRGARVAPGQTRGPIVGGRGSNVMETPPG